MKQSKYANTPCCPIGEDYKERFLLFNDYVVKHGYGSTSPNPAARCRTLAFQSSLHSFKAGVGSPFNPLPLQSHYQPCPPLNTFQMCLYGYIEYTVGLFFFFCLCLSLIRKTKPPAESSFCDLKDRPKLMLDCC